MILVTFTSLPVSFPAEQTIEFAHSVRGLFETLKCTWSLCHMTKGAVLSQLKQFSYQEYLEVIVEALCRLRSNRFTISPGRFVNFRRVIIIEEDDVGHAQKLAV